MSLAARGAYRDLLDHCYLDGSIPDDPPLLARMLGCDLAEFERIWPELRPHFRRYKRNRLKQAQHPSRYA